MATWGGSTPCHLDDDEDGSPSEMGAEEEEEEDGAESSSSDDIHIYSSSRTQCSYSNRKNQGRSDSMATEGSMSMQCFYSRCHSS